MENKPTVENGDQLSARAAFVDSWIRSFGLQRPLSLSLSAQVQHHVFRAKSNEREGERNNREFPAKEVEEITSENMSAATKSLNVSSNFYDF